jgi:hypothetical protein
VARGALVAPSLFSFDTNSTHAIWPRSAKLRNFFAVGRQRILDMLLILRTDRCYAPVSSISLAARS